MAFLSLIVFACSKNDGFEPTVTDGESVAMISIQVEGNLPGSRAVEDGHTGTDGQELMPKIISVTLIPYNEYGVEISQIDLTSQQMKDALWGKGMDKDGHDLPVAKPAGASVGLPAGTQKVDVVVNRPSGVNPTKVTNINYFNYRSDLEDKGDHTPGTTNNFERVYLTTAEYGMGKELGSPTSTTDGTPSYSLSFTVAPSLARFEIHGGINVQEAQTWVDGHGSNWKTMAKTAFETKYLAANGLLLNATTGAYTYKKTIQGVDTEVTFRNAVAGTADNGFDPTLVYFPEYYWYDVSGVGTPTALDKSTTWTEGQVDADPNTGAAWIKNTEFINEGTLVTWLPNMFYAVDVESVFINNIKVRGTGYTPYMHPWPGDQAATGWLDWYKAYHMGGWHTAGSSTGNTFLCMGNMWDRIATTANPATDEKTITFPSLATPGGQDNMNIIVKKAIPDAGKSVYYAANRNLGVATGKAAAFQIYSQSIAATNNKEQIMASLPHVILKVKAYENAAKYAAGDYVAAKEFITIKAFKQGNAYLTNFKSATIYRVNLNELLNAFVGKVPVPGGKPTAVPTDPIDPDPEMPGSQLNLTVQIVPWIIQNITPDI